MSSLPIAEIRACVFDAYGTLFDVNSAAEREKDALGGKWQPLAELWRAKQLQYTWLRALMGIHSDFWQVTGDALDFAMLSLSLDDPALRFRLMDLYLRLESYPEVKETLRVLKGAGLKLAILSNGTPHMLAAAVANSCIEPLLDEVLSVEEVLIYKPHPAVYAHAARRLGLAPREICFLSSNAWDAHGGKEFGFNVVWCNRFGQTAERLPGVPDAEIRSLSALPALLGIQEGGAFT